MTKIYKSILIFLLLVVTSSSSLFGQCKAEFKIVHDSLDYYSFYAKNTGSPTAYYKWDIDGDGNEDGNGQNWLGFEMFAEGVYYTTLTVTDSNCIDSVYINYFYRQNDTTQFAIQGKIKKGNAPAFHARVYAVKYDSIAGTLTAVDSTFTNELGDYVLGENGILYKEYFLIKAALNYGDSNYNNYIPTYYTNSLHWDSANLVKVDTDIYNINISLIPGNNPGGPGFIGGQTSQGANKTDGVGDPANHIQINLLDANKKPVAYTFSDSTGNFKFPNIAYGTYYISPEATGKKSNELMVAVSSTNPSINNVKVEVNKKYIDVSLLTGIKTVAILSGVEIWPNPANDKLYIKSNNSISNIYITDISGKHVLSVNKSENTINISSLDAGIYVIQIRTKEGMLVPYKFVKQ